VLLNSRYFAMGLGLAPSLRGRVATRIVLAMSTVDAAWAAAAALADSRIRS
jgi:predicted branched-subunit amino acid permease